MEAWNVNVVSRRGICLARDSSQCNANAPRATRLGRCLSIRPHGSAPDLAGDGCDPRKAASSKGWTCVPRTPAAERPFSPTIGPKQHHETLPWGRRCPKGG